jgi:type I restriction enzyme S subunit
MSEVKNVPELRFPSFEGSWERKSLSKVCEMKAGKFVKASSISETLEEGMYPCYGGNGLRGYTGTNTHNGLFPLIGRQGALCGNVQLASGEFHATEHAVVVNANAENESLWLYYQLDKLNLNRFATGQAQPGLSVDVIQKVKAYFPSREEQQKIADFLSSVDKKIEQLTEKHRLLTEYKKGVMQQIFTQQIRFKDDSGNDYPEWEYMHGNEVFKAISNKNHNSDLPILAITQDKGAIPRDMIDYKMTVTEASVSSYKVVEVGDFIISLRSFQGGIEYSEYKGICSPAYIILRARVDLNNAFYKYYLKTYNYIQELNRKLEGIRDGKMISYKYFSEIKLPFPCLEEQQKIANFLTEIDQKIDQAWSNLEQTKTFKKGLLQKMFV